MAEYSGQAELRRELGEVFERHATKIMEEAYARYDEDDDRPPFSMPATAGFAFVAEISDLGSEDGRWYLHYATAARMSPAHANGLLHEVLNNWGND